MTSLAEGLISAKDFSFTILLPAILVFVLIYALLSKTEVLGGNQWIDSTIAAITAILFVTVVKATEFTKEFLPLISLALIVLVFLVLVFRFVGVEGLAEGGGKIVWIIVGAGIVLVLAGVAFKRVFTSAYMSTSNAMSGAWQALTQPEVLSIIILFTTMILSVWLIARKG